MTKPALNKLKRSLFWVKFHKLYSLLILIVLLVGGIFVYQKVTLELNRRAFAQARVAIDAVYADIVAQVGQPDNYKRESECSKSYFGPYELRISCSVDTDFIYAVKDQQEADAKTAKINEIVDKQQSRLRPTSAPKSDIYVNPAPGDPDTNTSINYYKGPGGLLCIFKYVYDTPTDTYLQLVHPDSKKSFYVTTGCTGNAKNQYYPSLSSN